MNITKKGIVWELINSLWIILSFCGIPWASFLYIGRSTQRKKWQFWGALYLIIQLICIIGCAIAPYTLGMWSAIGLMMTYPLGIIHSFLVRKEFLITKEYREVSGIAEQENEKLREDIRKSMEKHEEPVEEVVEEDNGAFDYSQHLYSEESKININISTKEELLALPGVTSDIAEKAINFRMKFGGFASTKEFVEILQIDKVYLSEIQKKASVK